MGNYINAERFEARGVITQAEVIGKRIDYATHSNDGDDYYVTFDFDAGQVVRREGSVKSSFYRSVSRGGTTPIRYLPNTPKKLEYYVGEYRDKGNTTQIVAGVVGIIGLGLLWFIRGKANSAVLTRRWGHRTTATITGFVEHKNSGRPTGRGYMIWKTESGVRGESMDRSIHELRALKTGTKIIVYERKGASWWEGDVAPRKYPDSGLPNVSR